MRARLPARNDSVTVRKDAAGTPARERKAAVNRSTVQAQLELTEMMDGSRRVMRQQELSEVIHAGPRMTAQRREIGTRFDGAKARSDLPLANRTGLPDALKAGIENLSGYSLDDVKVHYNSAKPAQLQARAYAQGTDIHLGAGQEQYLPHEAWHVIQQKQGRVRPTGRIEGTVDINDDARLEAEADTMGALALRHEAPALYDAPVSRSVGAALPQPVAQRVIHLTPTIDRTAGIETLKRHPLYTDLNARADIYIRHSTDESNMKARNALDSQFKTLIPSALQSSNINYIISISQTILDNAGLDVEAGRAHHFMTGMGADAEQMATIHHQQAVEAFERAQDTPIPIFDINATRRGQAYPFISREPELEDSRRLYRTPAYLTRTNKLGVESVILHELGHVQQHLSTHRRYMKAEIGNVTYQHMPPLPENMHANTVRAYQGKILRDPIWTELVDMHNTMDHWIEPFHAYNSENAGDDGLGDTADRLRTLGHDIATKAMVWVEYDNIVHTEHSDAKRRGEPIRHIHGTEARIAPREGVPTMAELVSNNNQSAPGDLADVALQMSDNAHRLTAGIVDDAAEYTEKYTVLHAHLGNKVIKI